MEIVDQLLLFYLNIIFCNPSNSNILSTNLQMDRLYLKYLVLHE